MSRQTIHERIQTSQLGRDPSTGGSRYSPRPPASHKFTFQPPVKREQVESLHELGFLDCGKKVILRSPPSRVS